MDDKMEEEANEMPPLKRAKTSNAEQLIVQDTKHKHKEETGLILPGNDDTFKSAIDVIDNKEIPASSGQVVTTQSVEKGEENELRCEKHFGIEEYISKQKGVNGIIKQRYSDFMVREIDQDGKIVKLCSTVHNESIEEPIERNESRSGNTDCPITEDDLEKVERFCLQIKNEKGNKKGFVMLNVDNDKEHRKLVHLFIREKYENLDTETVQSQGEEKMVKVFCKKSDGSKRSRRQPKNDKKFCHFVLYKENRDTMNAINLIARLLHVKSSLLSYAGTKDKRAITTQKICAANIDAKKISTLNKSVNNIAVGDFEYKSCALKLGELGGNHFSTVIRNIAPTANEDFVSILIESIKGNGFINYFGMQRFGSGGVPTFEIGKKVLSSDWENVIKLILRCRNGEDDVISKAKQSWLETKDSKVAYEMIKKRKCIEEQVLNVLARQGEKSFYNAFQSIARNTRLMYIHSYQSFVWNKIVSKRIQAFGIHPIIGDLVLDKSLSESNKCDSMTRCKVKAITEDDIIDRTYDMTDIVMPLPGYDVTYPSYAASDWYSEMLSEDGFCKENMHHEIKEYSLSGAYRYMIVKPGMLHYKLAEYDDYCMPLLLSDIDLINGKELPKAKGGKYKALILEFSLPPSSYATMLLREVTKLDTSTHKNMAMNKCE